MSYRLKIVDFFRKTKATNIYYKELSQSQFLPSIKFKEIQLQRLRALLRHAYEHVPYYRRVFNERGYKPDDIQSTRDLQKMPILTKDLIRANYKDLLADNFKKYKPRLISSGGSTGEPLQFYIDRLTNSYQWADVYRGQIIGGWKPGERIARFWGTSVLSIQHPLQKMVYAWLNNWMLFPAFNSGESEMLKWINIIRSGKIRFLSGYVDTIVDFARFVINKGLQTQLVAVFPTTAPLTLSGRRLIAKAFGCGIFDLYQSADGGLSAIECHQHHGLHIAEERCLVEFPEADGEHEVPAIVTDLFNYAMPFIRYENGDELLVTNELCPCGRELSMIRSVRGKTYHHIILPNGQRVHSEIFSYYLNNFLIIKHFRALQTSPTDITLELVLDDRYIPEMPELKEALSLLPNSLPSMNVEVTYVDEIKKLPNQKYEIFVPYRGCIRE